MKTTKPQTVQKVFVIILTIIILAFFLFPVYIALLTALKSPMEIAESVLAFPKEWYFPMFFTYGTLRCLNLIPPSPFSSRI